MPALTTPICDFGWNAPDFELLGTDGKTIASLVFVVKMEH